MKYYLLFALSLLLVETAKPSPPPTVEGSSVLVLDAHTGNTLFSRNPDEPRSVGSTQKLLTSLVIVDNGNLDHIVTIEPFDEHTEPTMLNLKPGDRYTREQLLTALLVKSPNDVARALARDEAGSLENFSKMMNEKAISLGATSSHFVNPNGLPIANQYSTATDMGKIAMAVYQNPFLRSIIATRYFPFHFANGTSHLLENSNHTLINNSFCNGMKTGYTNKSKHCLLSSGSYGGHDVIVVILGAKDRKRLFDDSAELLRWGLGLPPETKHFMNVIHHSSTSSGRAPKPHHHRKNKKKTAPSHA